MAKGIPLMGRGPDGKAKIINVDENGNVKVQLSGAIREPVFRQTRTTSFLIVTKRVPLGAKGFKATLRVHGATGTFGANQGVALDIVISDSNSTTGNWCQTPWVTSEGTLSEVLVYPGIAITDGDFSPRYLYTLQRDSLAVAGFVRVSLRVEGTFEAGQGIDAEVNFEWLP